MSTKHVQKGFAISVTLGATYTSNDLIAVGTLCGVCLGSGVSGESIEVAIDEVFEVAKLATDVVTQGAQLYLDAANKHLTLGAAAGANIAAGKATAAAGNGVAIVQVKLNV